MYAPLDEPEEKRWPGQQIPPLDSIPIVTPEILKKLTDAALLCGASVFCIPMPEDETTLYVLDFPGNKRKPFPMGGRDGNVS